MNQVLITVMIRPMGMVRALLILLPRVMLVMKVKMMKSQGSRGMMKVMEGKTMETLNLRGMNVVIGVVLIPPTQDPWHPLMYPLYEMLQL